MGKRAYFYPQKSLIFSFCACGTLAYPLRVNWWLFGSETDLEQLSPLEAGRSWEELHGGRSTVSPSGEKMGKEIREVCGPL